MDTGSLDHPVRDGMLLDGLPRDLDQHIAEFKCVIDLQRIQLFRNLGPSELAEIARAAHRYEVAAASYFFQHGHEDVLYLLGSGRVIIRECEAPGPQRLLRVVVPGDLFGAIGDLREQLRPTCAQAVCCCRAIGWSRQSIGALMKSYPLLALNALSALEDQLCHFEIPPRNGGR